MTSPSHGAAAERMAVFGAAATIAGLLLSGPLGLALVTLVAPQPSWKGPMVFVEHFQRLQTLPFFASFIHAMGYLMLMAAIYQCADVRLRTRTMVAMALTTIFATLVSISYIAQTTFIPALTQVYNPDHDFAISMLSMANPRSFGWSLEMWGYGFLGLATWLVAPVFHRTALERLVAVLLIANGVVSIAGAIWTALDLAWVLTTPGLISYLGWNVLIVTISILLIFVFNRRRRTRAAAEEGLGSHHGSRISADSD